MGKSGFVPPFRWVPKLVEHIKKEKIINGNWVLNRKSRRDVFPILGLLSAGQPEVILHHICDQVGRDFRNRRAGEPRCWWGV